MDDFKETKINFGFNCRLGIAFSKYIEMFRRSSFNSDTQIQYCVKTQEEQCFSNTPVESF